MTYGIRKVSQEPLSSKHAIQASHKDFQASYKQTGTEHTLAKQGEEAHALAMVLTLHGVRAESCAPTPAALSPPPGSSTLWRPTSYMKHGLAHFSEVPMDLYLS